MIKTTSAATPTAEPSSAVEAGTYAFPLTYAQQQLWFLNELDPGNVSYNIPWAIRLTGDLDVRSLERSLSEIVQRHESFRTTFVAVDGEPRQIVAERVDIALPVTSLAHLDRDEREVDAMRLAAEEARQPLNLALGPLLRVRLIRLEPSTHVLLLTLHHIIFDGWSRHIFSRELAALYEAFRHDKPSPLRPSGLRYADYAVWQQGYLKGDRLDKDLTYWKRQLAGVPASLGLETDHPRPAVRTFNGAATPIVFSRGLSESLSALSRKHGASTFMTLLAGFQALLARYTDQFDIVVGTPIANRNRAELEKIIGLFTNTLVLRVDLSGDPGLGEIIERVKKTALEAYAHQELPFERLVEELNPSRSLSTNPLFEVMFSVDHSGSQSFELNGLELRLAGPALATARFDISVLVLASAEGLRGRIEYRTDLFDAKTIDRMAGHYLTLLEGAVKNPGLRLSELPLLTPAERIQILDDWNATKADYARDLCLHELFEQQAARTPEAPACLSGGSRLSYSELNARANRLARWLQHHGVGPGNRVGIFLEPTSALLVALLGIQKSGAACVPIDPDCPASYVCQMLQEARLSALVTELGARDSLPEALLPEVVCVLKGSGPDTDAILREPETNPASCVGPEDTIHLMFTRAPDGRLQAVETPHRAVVNVITSLARELEMGPRDVSPALASHSCDLCIPEIYLPLLTGGCVALGRTGMSDDGAQVAAFLRASGATIVYATPAIWTLLLQAGFNAHGLKKVIAAKALPQDICSRLLDSDSSLYRVYGPTETTLWAAFNRLRSADESSVIGRPLANNRIYILDRHQQPVPVGVTGEIYIGGEGLAHGYRGSPELTAERFPEDPFQPGKRMYRTGDLAKFLPDGRIRFQGQRFPATGMLDGQIAWWIQQLAGAPILLDLPTDRPRTSARTPGIAQRRMALSAGLRKGLAQLSHEEGVTLSETLLTAFSVLLARYSGQDDIVVGLQGVGRSHCEDERLTGFVPNRLALRVSLPGELTFRRLLHRVSEIALAAYAHQDVPFEKLVEALRPERAPGSHPLFQAMFLSNRNTHRNQNSDVTGEGFQPDLALTPTETADDLWITFDYSTDLFDASTIERMQKYFQNLLQGAVDNTDQEIARMPLLTISELRQQLERWNATERDYPRDACLQDLLIPFARHKRRRTAVVCAGHRISYGRLDERTNRLARHLRNLGVGRGSLVGVFLPRSIEMVVGLLGILKAGGAYVPLDPAHPKERIAAILEDTQAGTILTQRSISELLPAQGARRLYLDDDWCEIEREAASHLPNAGSPDDLAYVIFTSGSTGRPKGVEITHRNLVNLLTSMQREPGFSARDTLLAVTTLSFDIAGLEMFLPLISGGKLVIASREEATQVDKLKRLLQRSEATVLQATPATWRMLVESGWEGDRRLRALCGGEALPGDLASELRSRCLELWNMYGPTETTIWSSVFQVKTAITGTVPVGRPIANTTFYILDKHCQPAPAGVVGELCIGGLGVARGYLDRDEMTARKFLPDPFREGERMYRTGDQARFLPDGNVQFLGRSDDQVKLRGYRIELGEIESVLGRHQGVRECVVVLRDETHGQRLVAYVVTRQPRQVSGSELENHLKKSLPDYMIPSVVLLDSLPLTPAGKIERRALPAPEPVKAGPSQRSGPRDELEMAVLEIWERLLGIQNCAMTDNFFELGGHSLLLVRLSAMIEKEFNQTIPLSFLFERATIEKIAAFLRDSRADKSGFFLPFKETGSRPAFFCVHSLVGDVISCRHLARFLDPEQGFYGIQIPPQLRTSDFIESVETISRRYVSELLRMDPLGPYVLGGWSAGVPIALEMAQQLKQDGREVALLVVIDSVPANTGGGSYRLSSGYIWKLIRNLPRWASDDLALNFSWSELFRRTMRKVSGLIERVLIARRSDEEITQHRVRAFVTAGAYSESTNAFMQAFCLMLAKYIPKPYSGPVVLYKARTEPLFKAREIDVKWKKLASDLEIIEVNGTHITVLDERNVKYLAQDLDTRLRQCRSARLVRVSESAGGCAGRSTEGRDRSEHRSPVQ